MPENTFDIVSKIDLQEVSNAVQQALKEIHTRYDLKGSNSNITVEKDAIVLASATTTEWAASHEADRVHRAGQGHATSSRASKVVYRST